MAVENLDFDYKEYYSKTLIAAAKAANGYVYYETKLKYEESGNNLRPKRIDIYEKYYKPNSKAAALLKQLGVRLVIHKRS